MKIHLIPDGAQPNWKSWFIYILLSPLMRIWLFLFHKEPKYDKKYKVSVCTIFKNEAPFIKEWIEYQRIVGVDHFYMYNNNSTDNYLEILQPYIDEGIVTLNQWPEVPCQLGSYTHWYNNYRHESQWVSFLDLDEFFCPKYADNLVAWLDEYKKYPVVQIYWRMFGTSGLNSHDYKKLVIEQYHVCWSDLYQTGKILYNTDYDVTHLHLGMHHRLTAKVKGFPIWPINEYKKFVFDNIHKVGRKPSRIQVNHYWSKSWGTYAEKMKKGSSAYAKNWKTVESFYWHEEHNNSVDYSAYRFIIRLKERLGIIQI